ncbi:MAG: hypothetical protein IT379_20125 [Deltaproteobacteria bacterium]|nr:hypothetical protein [Deltaproteobacteria bacterium]
MPKDAPASTGLDSGLLVYATLAGLAGLVPLPLVDRALARRVAVGAVRRVAARHGVTVERAASRVLVRRTKKESFVSVPSVVRAILGRLLPALEMGSRIDDALRTFVTAALLDRYLGARPARWSGAFGEDEAKRVRAAIDKALPEGAIAAVKTAPEGAASRVRSGAQRGGSIAARADGIVDALLESLADAPGALGDRVEEAFDLAVADDAR